VHRLDAIVVQALEPLVVVVVVVLVTELATRP
jgi:hypothetical protein